MFFIFSYQLLVQRSVLEPSHFVPAPAPELFSAPKKNCYMGSVAKLEPVGAGTFWSEPEPV